MAKTARNPQEYVTEELFHLISIYRKSLSFASTKELLKMHQAWRDENNNETSSALMFALMQHFSSNYKPSSRDE